MKYLITLLLAFLHTTLIADTNTPLIISSSSGGLFHKYALDLEPVLSSILNSTVVIESKPGGNGVVAARSLMLHKAPRISLLLSVPIRDSSINQIHDIIPVAYLGTVANMLIAKPNPHFSNMTQLIEYSKNNNLNIGITTTSNVHGYLESLIERYSDQTRIKIISYRSGAGVVADVVGGHLDIGVSNLGVSSGLIQEGKLIALGAIGSSRSRVLSTIPTVQQQGYAVPGESKFFNHVILWANPGVNITQIQELRSRINQFLLSPEGETIMSKNGLYLDRRRLADPVTTISEILK